MKSNQKYIVEVSVSGIRHSKKEICIPDNLNSDEYEDDEEYINEFIWEDDFSEWESTFSPDDHCEYPLKIKITKI